MSVAESGGLSREFVSDIIVCDWKEDRGPLAMRNRSRACDTALRNTTRYRNYRSYRGQTVRLR